MRVKLEKTYSPWRVKIIGKEQPCPIRTTDDNLFRLGRAFAYFSLYLCKFLLYNGVNKMVALESRTFVVFQYDKITYGGVQSADGRMQCVGVYLRPSGALRCAEHSWPAEEA